MDNVLFFSILNPSFFTRHQSASPGTGQPGTGQLTTGQPSAVLLGTSQPGTGLYITCQPGTVLSGTSQLGTRQLITSQPGTVLPGTRHRAIYHRSTRHQTCRHRVTRHRVTIHWLSDKRHRSPGTSHQSSRHQSLCRITRHWTPVTGQPSTSHQAPVNSPGTGHQTATIGIEHWVASYIKGILCSHYRMSLRILDIFNCHGIRTVSYELSSEINEYLLYARMLQGMASVRLSINFFVSG